MKPFALGLFAAASLSATLLLSAPAAATGLMTCKSGPQAGWKDVNALKERLTKQGWKVTKSKVDGGCYEVYGVDPDGNRVEAYFHPVTFEKMLVSRRGEILFRKQ